MRALLGTEFDALLARAESVKPSSFAWHETLGVPPNADTAALRRAMAWLALIYHRCRHAVTSAGPVVNMPSISGWDCHTAR
jgi:hypothetical protein